ncbi:MAG: hypothetical protein ABR608_09670 [Pseudonocardiaceae bacterium]
MTERPGTRVRVLGWRHRAGATGLGLVIGGPPGLAAKWNAQEVSAPGWGKRR